MRRTLKDKGFDPGRIDGAIGPRAAAALRDYQKAGRDHRSPCPDPDLEEHAVGSGGNKAPLPPPAFQANV